ncbi:MAG: hypothetical protein AAFQ87_00740 [Bacteroidota bacterium]
MQKYWLIILLPFLSCQQAPVSWQMAHNASIKLSGDVWAGKPIGKELALPELNAESLEQWEAFVEDSLTLLGAEDKIPLSQALFLQKRESRFVELIERSLWNDGLIKAYTQGDSTYDPGDLAYVSGPDTLFVNLYVAGFAELLVNNEPLGMEVDSRYPWEESVRLRLKNLQKRKFVIALRIPGSSRNLPAPTERLRYLYNSNRKLELRVNEDLIMPRVGDGYAFIEREWQSGDKIDLLLPLAVRRVQDAKNPSLIALERGPILYAFPRDEMAAEIRLSRSRQYFLMDRLDGSMKLNWLRGPVWHRDQMIEAEAAPLFLLRSKGIATHEIALSYR